MQYHLAELNIAKAKYDLDSPEMKGFNDQLEIVNQAAEAHSGFVWRLQDESGDATSIRFFDDPRMIVNMSVWTDVQSLKDYIYRELHLKVFRQRHDWFEKLDTPHVVFWWIPAGQLPTLEQAHEKLLELEKNGPSQNAFDIRKIFEAPAE